ncbi:MAG: ankyrin repeat domain-containing protein [Rickettsiales bacterium]|nr:ankyrin repeat domain-containing protein [Rickettsiales bacterium]
MRRSSCFNTLLRITAISACTVIVSTRYSYGGEITFDQIKGEINWDDPKFLVEAQHNYQLAKEIQKDAKRRKQLRRDGKTDDEIKEIIKKERADRENAKLTQFASKKAEQQPAVVTKKENEEPENHKLQPADFGYSEDDEYHNNLHDITVKTEINNCYDAYRSGYKDALADMGGYGRVNYSAPAVLEPLPSPEPTYTISKPKYKSVSAKNFTPPVPVLPSGRIVVVNENAFVRKYDNNFLAQKQREGYVMLNSPDDKDDGFVYEKVPASKRFVSSKKIAAKAPVPTKRTLYADVRATNDNRVIKNNIQKEEAGAADFYDNDVSKYQITYDFTKSDSENDRLAHIRMPTVSYNGNSFSEFDRSGTDSAMYALTDEERTKKIQQAMLNQSSQARKKRKQAKKDAKKAKKQAEEKISKEEKALQNELKKYHEQKKEDAKKAIEYTKDIQMQLPSKIEMSEIDKIEKLDVQKDDEQRDDIIILNNDVNVGQTINLKKNGLTPAQIDAKNIGAPYPRVREDKNRLKQVLPQSIAQVSYDKNNRHLAPVVFENKVGEDIIKHFNDPNSVEFVRTFINNVGNVDIEDDDGNTLLMHAVANKHQSMITMLLSEGANPNFKNKLGFTPMHLAASNGDNKAMHYLTMAGGNPNLRDNDGNTPFMYSAMMCDKETNKLMIDMGGDVSMVNKLNKNKNILDYAYNNKDRSVQGFLMEKYKAAIKTKSKDLTRE